MAYWQADWKRRIEREVAARGFASLLSYLRQRPGVPYEALCREFGEEFAPIQLLHAHVEVAKGSPSEALDSLVRLLREELRRGGWGVGSRWRSKVISAAT